MAKKSIKKNAKIIGKNFSTMVKIKPAITTGSCCEKEWNLVPLRFALGLMFLAAGLPKLLGMIAGGNQTPVFFASLGIPLPVFSSWLVAIIEVIGGVMLMLGFMTCLTGSLLVIIIVVAALTTSIQAFNWFKLMQHLVYIAGLVAVMCGSKFFSLRPKVCRNCCKK